MCAPRPETRGLRIAERTEIALPPDVLARYPGTYRLQPGFDLVITLENGQLISQATGQAKAPIFAEAENKFFLKAANAQIEFVSEGGARNGARVDARWDGDASGAAVKARLARTARPRRARSLRHGGRAALHTHGAQPGGQREGLVELEATGPFRRARIEP